MSKADLMSSSSHRTVKKPVKVPPMFTESYDGDTQIVTIDNVEFEYTSRASKIRERDGSAVHQMDAVFFPPHFSQNAIDVISQKYFRKRGVVTVDESETTMRNLHSSEIKAFKGGLAKYLARVPLSSAPTGEGETSAHQVFHRLAGCWTHWGIRTGHFKTLKEADKFYLDVYTALYNQEAAPNSPQWFNTGLNWAYGISRVLKGTPAYYYSARHEEVRESFTAYDRPQPHACFIQSVDDTLIGEGGIMDLFVREATVFKYGSGSGTNYSKVRGVNESLEGGGVSSGLMSFLTVGDRSAGSIKSGGTTRRAARMVVIDMDHPEIEKFIDWKVEEENKVAALVTGSQINKRVVEAIVNAKTEEAYDAAIAEADSLGIPSGLIQRAILAHDEGTTFSLDAFDTDWQSEAYQTVNGQNANNSVSVTDAFLRLVENDGDWTLTERTTGKPTKIVKARHLWDRVSHAAWACADPGIQYYDTINYWNTCLNDEPIVASNPCSEYFFLNDTACNLASLNILRIYERSDEDIYSFGLRLRQLSALFTTVLDISVDMAQFPSKAIAERTYQYRTLGLGYANLGAFLMNRGLAYGSDESCAVTEVITALMTGTAYATSADNAKKLGAFPRYTHNESSFKRVMGQHCDHADKLRVPDQYQDIDELASTQWNKVAAAKSFRNAQVSVIAPTGTIGLAMDCDTTGIEPDFSLVKTKKLAGGGYMRIANQGVSNALLNRNYPQDQRVAIERHIFGLKAFPYTENLIADGKSELDYITREDLLDLGVPKDILTSIEARFGEFWTFDQMLSTLQKESGIEVPHDQNRLVNTATMVFGHGHVENAPYLSDEDKEIFLTAVPAKGAKNSITALSHMKIMAAAQKYVSGAISKTINLPFTATERDIQDVYNTSHKLGIKAVAVYRDGSKLSQPLMTSMIEVIKKAVNKAEKENNEVTSTTEVVQKEVERVLHQAGVRRRVPHKANGYRQKATIGGHKIYTHTGEFEDGSLGEIFIDLHKEGATLRAMMNNFAIAVSIGLQYGVPLSEFVEAFTYTRFEPAGIVRDHANLKNATSILDYIFRDLGYNYEGRADLVQVPDTVSIPTKVGSVSIHPGSITVEGNVELLSDVFVSPNVTITERDLTTAYGVHTTPQTSEYDKRREAGYTGDTCLECGSSRMKRTGACITCEECGTNTGCS